MPDDGSRKGFWGSLADGVARRREESKRKREEFFDDTVSLLGALSIMSGKLPEDIDKALGVEGKLALANSLLEPGSPEEKLAALRKEKERLKAIKPLSPEEQHRRDMEREVEREAERDFGKRAAYQAAGQRRIAEFLKERSAGLSPDEIRREIENINDWVQRKIDSI